MKKSLLLVLTTIIIVAQTPIVHAQELKDGDELVMKQTVATFDLENIIESETITIITEAGSEGKVTVERVDSEGSQIGLMSVKNDTYRIHYSSLAEKISYLIDIRNNSIVSAYSGTYSVFGYSVTSSNLRINNSKYASYTLECSFLFRSWTNSLNARINGSNQLEIQFNK